MMQKASLKDCVGSTDALLRAEASLTSAPMEPDALAPAPAKDAKACRAEGEENKTEHEGQAALARMDSNKDGVVDKQEFAAAGGSQEEFDRHDLNGDEKLDRDKMGRLIRRMPTSQIFCAAQHDLATRHNTMGPIEVAASLAFNRPWDPAALCGDDPFTHTSLRWVDQLFHEKLPLDGVPAVIHKQLDLVGGQVLAGGRDQLEDRMANLSTMVLASVNAPGWRAAWIQSLVGLLIMNTPHCSFIHLLAMQGGSGCASEIQFIEHFLPLVGAQQGLQRKAISPGVVKSEWTIARAGASKCTICLWLISNTDHYIACQVLDRPEGTQLMSAMFRTGPEYACAPNLIRCHIVSAPANGPRAQRFYIDPRDPESRAVIIDTYKKSHAAIAAQKAVVDALGCPEEGHAVEELEQLVAQATMWVQEEDSRFDNRSRIGVPVAQHFNTAIALGFRKAVCRSRQRAAMGLGCNELQQPLIQACANCSVSIDEDAGHGGNNVCLYK